MNLTKESRLNYNDALQIPNFAERTLALFLLTHVNLLIWYHPFIVNNSTPDFFIRNSNYPNSPGTIVEITISRKARLSKRKREQMGRFSRSGMRSTVLCFEHLKKITRLHPNVNFFNGKNEHL